MRAKTLIILVLAGLAQAQSWPSGALSDLSAGAKPVSGGLFRFSGFSSSLSNEVWTETRMSGGFEIGVAHGLALSASSGNRDLSGKGAFQAGTEDARLGLAVWPLSYKERLHFGLNGQLVLPTGFRDEQSYYDSLNNEVISLPAYSLEQTAGQFSLGTAWNPGKAAELSAFMGYFGTSNNSEQALRWGLGLSLTPFGKRVGASVRYGQSITRVGNLPDTEVLRGGLDLKLPWGFGLHPGMYVELQDDPMMGTSIGLSFTSRLPRSIFPPKADAPQAVIRSEALLLPPPLSNLTMADNEELWKQMRESLTPSFETVLPLASLDRPGLPFNELNRTSYWNSLAAISAAHPNVRWLLITHVEEESVTRKNGLSIPLLVSQPKLQAECKITIQLIDLFEQSAYPETTVLATAILKDGLQSPLLSTIENEKISIERAREITLIAYRKAGREVALALPPIGEDE